MWIIPSTFRTGPSAVSGCSGNYAGKLHAYCRRPDLGFLQEVEYLHSKGLALGGSLGNAVVLDEDGIVNPEGLRCPDEFVRHKILDFVGDMAMFGMPLQALLRCTVQDITITTCSCAVFRPRLLLS